MNIKKPQLHGIRYRVYDNQGMLKREIEKAKEKDDITNNDWLKGVSCFVINEKNEVLIEKRVGKGLNPGKLDLCSGHIDNNEISMQAMIRELKEELGIELSESINIKRVGSGSAPLNFGSEEKKKNFFIDFFCLKRNCSNVTIQEEEVERVIWIPLEECFELIRSGKTKFPKDYNYEKIFTEVKEICLNKRKEKNDFERD